MTEEVLKEELKKLDIDFTTENQEKTNKFYELLIKENQKYNLTSIKEKEDVYLKHIYDSLTLVKTLNLQKEFKILDIGSGAGFPGIVLSIFFPNLKITLLDSNNKKTRFLNLVKEKLNLNNTIIINKRAEEYIINNREKYDIVVARAVSSLNILIELAIPFLKINGLFIAMKAKWNKEEIQLGKDTCNFLNCEILEINKFKLPIENSDRTLIKIKKNNKTNNKYPRRYDQIIKNPLIKR